MNLLKRHLTVANAISCMALFVALSGIAYAANTIGNKAVKAQNLANGSVTAPKIRREAVTIPKIRNGAVISTKIATGAVGTTQIADGSVRSSKLGGGVVTSGKLKDGAVTAAKLSSSLNAQLPKNISYATASSASNTSEETKTATAFCPTGKQVVGGGGKVIGGNVLIVLTETAPTPINADSKRIGWSAIARETTTSGTNWSVEAYAVCAEF